jgi:uncharacterized protein with PIN domain
MKKEESFAKTWFEWLRPEAERCRDCGIVLRSVETAAVQPDGTKVCESCAKKGQ